MNEVPRKQFPPMAGRIIAAGVAKATPGASAWGPVLGGRVAFGVVGATDDREGFRGRVTRARRVVQARTVADHAPDFLRHLRAGETV